MGKTPAVIANGARGVASGPTRKPTHTARGPSLSQWRARGSSPVFFIQSLALPVDFVTAGAERWPPPSHVSALRGPTASTSERVRARQSASESVSRPSAGRHSALWRPVPAANPNSSIPLNLPFHRRLAPAVGALSNHTSSFKVNHQMTNVNLAPPLHWLSGGNNNNNNISNIFYSNLK